MRERAPHTAIVGNNLAWVREEADAPLPHRERSQPPHYSAIKGDGPQHQARRAPHRNARHEGPGNRKGPHARPPPAPPCISRLESAIPIPPRVSLARHPLKLDGSSRQISRSASLAQERTCKTSAEPRKKLRRFQAFHHNAINGPKAATSDERRCLAKRGGNARKPVPTRGEATSESDAGMLARTKRPDEPAPAISRRDVAPATIPTRKRVQRSCRDDGSGTRPAA